MGALRVIRAGAIGVAAVAASTIAVWILRFVMIWMSLGPFVASLGATLILVAAVAWACVHIGHFPRVLAALLPALPFVLVSALLIGTQQTGPICFGVVLLLFALFFAWAGTGVARGQINLSRRSISYTAIGVIGFVLAWEFTVRFTAVPIHAFDRSWDGYHSIPIDARVTHMAARAQFDSYVSGIPPIGRGRLRLESAARHGSDYDLFFVPTWASDTLVVYRFCLDGKPLWKTCTWVET